MQFLGKARTASGKSLGKVPMKRGIFHSDSFVTTFAYYVPDSFNCLKFLLRKVKWQVTMGIIASVIIIMSPIISWSGLYTGSWNGGSNLLNSRSHGQMQGSGSAVPAAVAYLTKDNPENPLLTHTAKNAINYIIALIKTVINYLDRCIFNLIKCLKSHSLATTGPCIQF